MFCTSTKNTSVMCDKNWGKTTIKLNILLDLKQYFQHLSQISHSLDNLAWPEIQLMPYSFIVEQSYHTNLHHDNSMKNFEFCLKLLIKQ